MARKELRHLTTGDIAQYCGVNFRTVIRWIKRGHLKAYQLPGRGDNRVTREDFIQFLKQNKMIIPEDFITDFEKNKPRVLILENEKAMGRAIERVLRLDGYETQIALDGFQAGTLLPMFEPVLMTLDLAMPGISGQDVLKYVRSLESFKKLKVLVISARAESELKEALKFGADAVLEKPFKNEELLKKVHELL